MKISGKIMNFNGIPLSVPNDITSKNKNFYISYNSKDITIYGNDTTALVDNDMTKFLILNGNHSKNYNLILENNGNYNDCMKYFLSNLDKKNKYSDNV